MIMIKEGQTAISAMSQHLGWMDRQRVKWAMRGNDALKSIQPGQYTFSGNLTTDSIIETLIAGPTSTYQRITVLE